MRFLTSIAIKQAEANMRLIVSITAKQASHIPDSRLFRLPLHVLKKRRVKKKKWG